ncbi:MAG: CPBP family intramembrane metalloprotease [Clostridia bacterium]|nr:CPBP family intramembrane metalloprotease [Clostridia bacterium]
MASFTGQYFTPDYFYRKEQERKNLRRAGALCGLALLGYVLIQNIIALGIQAAGLWDKYTTDKFFQSGADIFLTFAGVLLPFTLINRIMKKYTGVEETLVFERKTGKLSVLGAVISGAGMCMEANIVSSFFITFMGSLGFTLSSPEVPMPEGTEGFLLSFIRVVVVAAMAEELSLRGYVMGNLRKYGDVFAIGVSAVLFAIMHGNLIQSPFALIAGFAIGYFTVKTGTLWTAVLIHGANNFISLALSYIMVAAGEETGTALTALCIYALGTVGLIGTAVFARRNKDRPFSVGETVLSPGEKISAFFLNIPMIAAFLLMLYITSTYVNFGR